MRISKSCRRTLAAIRCAAIAVAVIALPGTAQASEWHDALASGADAQRQLRAAAPSVRVISDAASGTVRSLVSPDAVLATPDSLPLPAFARADDPHRVVRSFVARYAALFGGDERLLEDATVERDYVSAHNGLRTVVWSQQVGGIPVQDGRFVANIAGDGSLLSISNRCMPHVALAAALARPSPALTAAQAVAAAIGADAGSISTNSDAAGAAQAQSFTSAGARGGIDARLTWARAGGALRLAWEVTAADERGAMTWLSTIDAQDATVLSRRCLTKSFMSAERAAQLSAQILAAGKPGTALAGTASSLAPAIQQPAPASLTMPTFPTTPSLSTQSLSLLVFAQESPTPMLPGLSSASSAQPAAVARVAVSGPGSTTASPNNWINDGVTITVGNNVDAHPDANGDNVADSHPSGGGPQGRDFTPAIDLTQAPSTYTDAAVVNVFYWCNVMHDRLYLLGFDEAAGNFQATNFGRGGIGGDAVQADAQDSSGLPSPPLDNANFSTSVDGTSARMQMYDFSGGRDGDLDATVVCHEYTHGLSTRLVGSGDALNSLQAAGMGEGWSDFYALSILVPSGADPNACYPVGAYAIKGLSAFPDNYFTGIRRNPYSTDLTKSPLTLDALTGSPEVHDMGEIWCNALWQGRANLIARLGDPAGNTRMLQLVTDAMRLTPDDPSYIQARDAIIQADMVDFAGADLRDLWSAFAKRGMGPNAEIRDANGVFPITQDTAPIGDLFASPGTYYDSGVPGDGFAGRSKAYTVRNLGATTLDWSASSNQGWVTVIPSSGTLAPGATATVQMTLTAAAAALPSGAHLADVTFANTTNASGTSIRAAHLDVGGTYVATATTFAWLTPAAPVSLTLADDAFSAAQALPFTFTFYGSPETSLYVGSNGLVSFNTPTAQQGTFSSSNQALGDPTTINGLICPLWYDFNPAVGSPAITVGTTGIAPNRTYVITWGNLRAFGRPAGEEFSFQIQLKEGSTDIVCAYQQVRPTLSYGGGKLGTIGVEHQGGLLATTYDVDGTARVGNSSGLRFTYGIPPTTPAPGAAVATSHKKKCGHGLGIAVVLSLLLLGAARRRHGPPAEVDGDDRAGDLPGEIPADGSTHR